MHVSLVIHVVADWFLLAYFASAGHNPMKDTGEG